MLIHQHQHAPQISSFQNRLGAVWAELFPTHCSIISTCPLPGQHSFLEPHLHHLSLAEIYQVVNRKSSYSFCPFKFSPSLAGRRHLWNNNEFLWFGVFLFLLKAILPSRKWKRTTRSENLGEEGKTFLKVNSNNTAQHLFQGYATKQRKTDVPRNAPVSLQTQVLFRAAAAHGARRDAPRICSTRQKKEG